METKMTEKTARFPNIRTTPELKDRVMATCESLNIKYSTVVTQLLKEWTMGERELKFEPDEDFVAAAKEAFASEESKEFMTRAVLHYKKNIAGRELPNAIEI
jgi:antitoxin component of RelBE/YafQ-DinJ toxin-antitoxin module